MKRQPSPTTHQDPKRAVPVQQGPLGLPLRRSPAPMRQDASDHVPYRPTTPAERERYDDFRRRGRLAFAPGSNAHLSRRELEDQRNWFLSPDGNRLWFDPAYARGYRHPPGELAKDRYRLGDVPGYDEHRAPWRALDDQAIIRATYDFNRSRGFRPGDAGYLSPHFVKVMMMKESGGEGTRTAFRTDALQVYNPGDWEGQTPEQTRALREERSRIMQIAPPPPDRRDTLRRLSSPDRGVRAAALAAELPRFDERLAAALRWYEHKRTRYGASGQPTGYRDRWSTLRNYNGDTDRTGARENRDIYADTITAWWRKMRKNP